MKHLKMVSEERPARAQLEPLLQLVGLKQGIAGLPGIFLGQGQQILGMGSTGMGILGSLMNLITQIYSFVVAVSG